MVSLFLMNVWLSDLRLDFNKRFACSFFMGGLFCFCFVLFFNWCFALLCVYSLHYDFVFYLIWARFFMKFVFSFVFVFESHESPHNKPL